MLENGAVFIHRSITSWEWYKDVPTRVLFEHLILTVNWKESTHCGEEIRRGERTFSLQSLAEESGLTLKQVRRALENLGRTGEISVRGKRNDRIIAVNNFETFQNPKKIKSRAKEGQSKNGVVEPQTDGQEVDQGKSRAKAGQKQGKSRAKGTEFLPQENIYIKKSNKAIKQEYSAPARTREDTPPFITLPLNDGTEYPIYEDRISKWEQLYPAVDVKQSLRSMRGWCDANPAKRKTKAGILRFVAAWLSREQDRGGNRVIKTTESRMKTYDTEDAFNRAVNRTKERMRG